MLKIGYLGPEGTYSSYAAKLYDSENLKIPFNTINEVLNSLKSTETNQVVVPLENSINGSIVEVLDFLASKNNYHIVSELNIEINHSVYCLDSINNEDVRVVYSHPQALAQCYDYSNNFKNVKHKASNSTTDSYNDLINSTEKGVFIGPPWMKDNETVMVIGENVQSVKNNVTRFVVISDKIKIKKQFLTKLNCYFF